MDKDLGTFIVESQGKPLKINQIIIDGIQNTNNEFLEVITKPLLEAKTLGDIIVGSRNVGSQLKNLGIFKDVSISFEADSDSAPDTVDVIYKVTELPRLFARTGADFGNSDSNLVFLF
jgi:outer membrane protein assembly factor BamA